ncbi:unnamed protein product [Diabrotica balteata]|uniref:Voltage-dependent anion-selective channel protein 3 n=1 Tax=Diabrotica balteata TaxID=107213 RepID=A0A9N9T271_DIABA|nr:unnamed protein product [Diabrotica balteata]
MENAENPCKTKVHEKVYVYPRIAEECQDNDRKEIDRKPKKIDCKKKGELEGILGKNGIDKDILEMAPPPYADLGKRARDVFGNGYHFGLIKLNCKTKTASGVQFSTGGSSDHESGKVSGSLESKYTVKDYGLTFTEKWNTNNTLGTEIAISDQGIKGLKVSGNVNFSPQEGYQSGVVKSEYGNERIHLNADVDLNSNGPVVKGSAVVGYQGWLAGYQAAFDVQNSKLAKSNFALGFSTSGLCSSYMC